MNELAAFDQSVFDLLKSELGAEDTAEVLRTFLADTGRKIQICAASGFDRTLVKREAHAIKSSAAAFGFMELSDHARSIEGQVIAMTTQQMQDAIQALQDLFERTSGFARSVLLAPEVGIARWK
ncbi:MAG TPA: Hpt domain-containing protein [Bradyrhizobium sp.]|nr:Hpt domain-containing protein [Bradyrhizobium sp.]